MAEERVQIRIQATRIDYRCDRCSQGFLKLSETQKVPAYTYFCPNCGETQVFDKYYPLIEIVH